MTKELWLAVLSSSLISGVIGALIAGWFGLRAKRSEYVNEYYKLVLARRITAYEKVERLIIMLKAAVLGDDNRPYHLLFSQEKEAGAIYKLIFKSMSQGLWLTDDLFARIRELNLMFFDQGSGKDGGLVEFGKRNYSQLAELRTKIEIVHNLDMLELHDIRRFLKGKKPSDFYTPVGPVA
ncbi:MAG: hypothetical protein ABI365_09165 [Lysobacteraceae bacterium]